MNLPTILITLVLILVVAGIIVHLVQNKKKGKTSCGGGCGSCPMSGKCHQGK